MNYLDMIFIGILVVCGYIAYKKGMIKTIFGFCSTLLSVVIAYLFYGTLSNFLIQNTEIDDKIQLKIGEALDLEQLAEGVITKQDQVDLISNLELPGVLKNIILSNNNPEIYKLIDVQGIVDYISSMITRVVMNALSFVILFIVALIALAILAYLLDFAAKLPVLKQINSYGGLAIGLALGVLINWIVCVVMYVIIGFKGDGELLAIIQDSFISKFFYENNPIVDFIMDVTRNLK